MSRSNNNLAKFIESNQQLAVIEVTGVQGSAPRSAGTWMLVGAHRIFGTIGGGRLEFDAIAKARKLLAANSTSPLEVSATLGPDTGQCCGGVVFLEITVTDKPFLQTLQKREQKDESDRPHVHVFGAGHVGKALANALALLPVLTVLIDTREEQILEAAVVAEKRWTAIPEQEVRTARAGSAYVILTHDHSLDFLIAREALLRGDAAYVGMIGSKTKRAAFQNWLRREEGSDVGVEKLICPIGSSCLKDKRPEVIAALTAAEIMDAFLSTKAVQIDIEDNSREFAVR